MKTRGLMLSTVLLVICLLVPLGASAQEQPPATEDQGAKSANFGAALSLKFPHESFAVQYDTGFGVYGIMDYPFIPLLDLAAGIGWNHFPAGAAGEAIDVWEFMGGARFRLGVFFMSGEVAYYTKIEETSFLPGLGLRFEHFELAFNIRAVSGGSWQGLRLGYYF